MIVLGTAGHIDHGKTTLVKALTGVDTDRLKVERERGITTELGFAHVDLDGLRVAVVDAPGHERFVRHMIAGAGGLDAAMLVVAADEGVMPQTREHLDILGLIGVQRGFVVVTKVDLVEADDLALAIDDIRGSLAGTFLDGAPLVTFAATRAESVAEARLRIADILRALFPRPPVRPLDRPFRMAIDRVFVMAGFGTIVTGTVTAGQVSVGAELEILPSEIRGRVRTLQNHGVIVDHVGAGMRAAINLQGVSHEDVERGQVLAAPGAVRTSMTLDATVTLLRRATRPLRRRTHGIAHTGTVQVEGALVLLDRDELAPGESCLCQLRLSHPVAALGGDAYVFRGFETLPGYGRTLGGGRVLTPGAPLRRAKDVAAAALLAILRDGEPFEQVQAAVELGGEPGLDTQDLLAVSELGRDAIAGALSLLLRSHGVSSFMSEGANRYLGQAVRVRVEDRVLAAMASLHARATDRDALPAEEIRLALPRPPDPESLAAVLDGLVRAKRLRSTAGGFALAGHSARSAGIAEEVLARVEGTFAVAGLATPTQAEVATALALPAATVRDALTALIRAKRVVRLTGDLFFAATVIEDLRQRLVAFLEGNLSITTQQFKELAAVSRKYAIPLAEYFDSTHVTLRISDSVRKLRR